MDACLNPFPQTLHTNGRAPEEKKLKTRCIFLQGVAKNQFSDITAKVSVEWMEIFSQIKVDKK